MNGHANGSGQGVVKPRKPETSRLFLVPVGLILGLLWVKACAALMLHLPPSSFGEGSPDTHLRGPRHLDGPPADVVQLQLWTQAGKLGATTNLGALRVRLRPDLSASSADFVREAATARCAGSIDRADEVAVRARFECSGAGAPQTAVAKGPCPPGVVRECPPDEPQCGCHGPLLRRGMVAWADGGTGPAFVVLGSEEEGAQKQFGNWHTIIGDVEGEASWTALDRLRALPAEQTHDGWLRPRSAAFRVTTAA